MNSAVYIFLAASVILLAAGSVSLVAGKTVGLYGVWETRTSPFYWIIVVTYIGLGLMCLYTTVRLLLR